MAAPLKIMSTIAVEGALPAIAAAFKAKTGAEPTIDFAPTGPLVEKIRQGARGDVAVLTVVGLDSLTKEGVLSAPSRVNLVDSLMGVTVKAGARMPDISTKAAFLDALNKCQSFAYSQAGASGLYFADLIKKLGIEDMIKPKARIVQGFTAKTLISGEAELALQQIAELLMIPGIEQPTPLPDELQVTTTFGAAAFAQPANGTAAADFMKLLVSAEASALFKKAGLDPLIGP